MKPDKTKTAIDRRSFLLTAGLAAGAAGVAVLARAGQTAAAPKADAAKASVNYRETEHVRRFYELARF